MDKKKSLDLIKLEVLGCLSDKDKESLQAMRAEGNEFPWKELGDYQNLIAIMPLALELKYPATDLKDKTAMKLYSIRDQIKAKIDAKKALEMPSEPEIEISSVEEEIEIEEHLEEKIVTEQIEVEEKVFAEVEEGVQFNVGSPATGKEETFRLVSKFKEKNELENSFRQAVETETKEPVKTVVDKDLVEKIAREIIKNSLGREVESLNNTIKKNRMLSFILFAFLFILLLVMFFIK